MRRSTIVVAVLVSLGTSAPSAEATECIWPATVGHALMAGSSPADVVRGRIVGMRLLQGGREWTEIEWAVEVTSSRGVRLPSLVTVRSAATARCGNPIGIGGEYYFFTQREKGRLVAGLHEIYPASRKWEERLTAAFGHAVPPTGRRCGTIVSDFGLGLLHVPGPIPGTTVRPSIRSQLPRVDGDAALLAYSILAVLSLAAIGIALRCGDRRFGRI